jgi:hypothetical protein
VQCRLPFGADPCIANLARECRIGSIDLVSDSTSVLEQAALWSRLRELYPR